MGYNPWGRKESDTTEQLNFCILAVCEVLFIVEFPHLWVWLDGWFVKVSWLGKLVLVFLWVELDFFSLECNEVSSNEL